MYNDWRFKILNKVYLSLNFRNVYVYLEKGCKMVNKICLSFFFLSGPCPDKRGLSEFPKCVIPTKLIL